jgi:6-phosphogluconolactonase (cycloisomerase 2 family)
MKTPLLSLLSLLIITVLFSCKKLTPIIEQAREFSGFIYTSTNATSGNAIIALGRNRDGSVKELDKSPYSTGAAGDAAEGDFDAQWSLRIVGDYLLAVNAGANPVNGSISVFKINRLNGSLTQIDQNPSTAAVMDNMDSYGVRSTSIAASYSGGKTWIVVGNQYANPHYEGNPAVPVGFPIVSTNLRNLAVFTFDESTGLLQFKKIGATYMDGDHGGPCTVDFNASGTKLAVSTWGVPHILVDNPDLSLQKPGALHIYSFADGNLTETGMYKEEGVSGNIGFSWSPNDKYIYLTNFNLHSSKVDNSVTVHDATTAAKVQNFATALQNDEACWTHISMDNNTLYTASFAGNNISAFDIAGNDELSITLDPNYWIRRNVPSPDTKDMYEADRCLYVSGAYLSHTISFFKMLPNGALDEMQGSPYAIPTSAGKTPEQHAYLGLTGFEKWSK